MKNVLFLSSWYPSRVHTTLGNFVRYHALAASKYNSINVLYIVADDNVKDYEIKFGPNVTVIAEDSWSHSHKVKVNGL